MKILFFVTGLKKGGAEKQLFYLISNLITDKNYSIKVISIEGGYYFMKYSSLGVDVSILKPSQKYNVFSHLAFLKRELSSFKPDVLHSFLNYTNFLSKFLLLFIKKNFKLICSYRCKLKNYPLYYLLEYINKSVCDLAIGNSVPAIGDIDFFSGEKKVIFNAFEPSLGVEKKLFFNNRPTVLTVANFRPEKDYESNLLVCKLVKEKIPDVLFVYVGFGPQEKKIKSLAKTYDLMDNVSFEGYKSSVEKYYLSADVFFLPTKGESQSNSLLEAMYYKLPIVTTRLIENTSIVPDGLFCSVSNVNCMAESILAILSGCSKVNVDKNYVFLKNNFSVDNNVSSYKHVYSFILN